MFNLKYLYDQHSTRLQIEGFPDISLDHSENTIGIISSWKLSIAGYPELEGKKEHLKCLIDVLYPYSRYYLLGIKRAFGDNNSPVAISTLDVGHQLILRSSQKDVKPLKVTLDDAELVDLISCIDKFRNDKRIQLSWSYSYDKKVKLSFNLLNKLTVKNLTPFTLGAASLILFSAIFVSTSSDPKFFYEPEPNKILNKTGLIAE